MALSRALNSKIFPDQPNLVALLQRAQSARVNPRAKLHLYLYIQLPLVNTPVQPSLPADREAVSRLILFIPCARCKMLRSISETCEVIICFVLFHKHVTHSGFTLRGVKLIDGVGEQVNIRGHKTARCEEHKLHKGLQHEGVCHVNAMLS